MKLYFARHGESEANVIREISNRGWRHGLTEKGRQQAADLAVVLRDSRARCIYTSPLRRAVETAEILSACLAIPCEITDALREYDCGSAEGRADVEGWQQWRDLRDAWVDPLRRHECIPGGETFFDVQARFEPFVRRLLLQEETDAIILVGHGGTYAFMLPLVLTNIQHSFSLNAPFPNTGYVLAEFGAQGLTCTEWCGRPVANE
jgi:2,3-bisphosphoglycerate-dependent phosphoglycerate mutase